MLNRQYDAPAAAVVPKADKSKGISAQLLLLIPADHRWSLNRKLAICGYLHHRSGSATIDAPHDAFQANFQLNYLGKTLDALLAFV
jgi:hypothetical protein